MDIEVETYEPKIDAKTRKQRTTLDCSFSVGVRYRGEHGASQLLWEPSPALLETCLAKHAVAYNQVESRDPTVSTHKYRNNQNQVFN